MPVSPRPRIFTIGDHWKGLYGKKVIRLGIDAGFTCPTRDGRISHLGCRFCKAGSRGPLSSPILPIVEQMSSQRALLADKWPDALYMPYFQSFTGTYAPPERLLALYKEAVSFPASVGLIVATRPDCLEDPVLEVLAQIQKSVPVLVELGLQSARDDTAERIGRGYPSALFVQAVRALRARGIETVAHIIAGLPGESSQDCLESALFCQQAGCQGLKIHMLGILQGTPLALDYQRAPWPLLSQSAYVSLVCDLLERISPNLLIHRMTGDPLRVDLITPRWVLHKRAVLNAIGQEMQRRDSFHGKYSLEAEVSHDEK